MELPDFTRQMLTLALNYAPKMANPPLPKLEYDNLKKMTDFDVLPVSLSLRETVSKQLLQAFCWASDRFPLSIDEAKTGLSQPTIESFAIAHSPREKEILSASSIQAPLHILLAVDWPLKSIYRLASIIVHESMHQALYVHERSFPSVRYGSLGYSPWRTTLRAGRMVWHAFWTFSVQYAVISDALLADNRIVQVDPDILNYTALMQERIRIALNSLELFDITAPPELRKCEQAVCVIDAIACELRQFPLYDKAEKKAATAAFNDYRLWAEAFENNSHAA